MGRLVAAILLSGFVSSMTDWFFGGVLFHKKYLAFPEVWRRQSGQAGEGKAIGWAVWLGFVTCAAFILTSVWFGIHGHGATLRLAVAIWIIAPLPLMITNALFIKLHPLNVVANSLGWLVKLLLAGIAAGWV